VKWPQQCTHMMGRLSPLDVNVNDAVQVIHKHVSVQCQRVLIIEYEISNEIAQNDHHNCNVTLVESGRK